VPVLQIVVGSTRPGRAGAPVAAWTAEQARAHGGFDVEVLDLAEIDLPMFDEPIHPVRAQYTNPHTKRWSETVARGDAYVFVTPEYNGSYAGVLKNAIDFLNHEWRYKPAGIVSYGGVSAGTRAAVALRSVLTTLRMVPAVDAVHIPFVGEKIAEDGTLVANDIMVAAAKTMFDEIERLRTGITPLRPAP
jgi:NAD(P)H-dependent FMN reductase